MGFVTLIPPDPHGHGRTCTKPNSRGAREFGVGTVWQCDACGRRYRLAGVGDDQRDGPYDKWEPVAA